MDKHGEMETFVRVAEQGSFSAAARDLGMTPSAVSRVMQRLETRLGVRLVERSTRRLRLTPEGKAFYTRASRILEDIADAEHTLAGMKGQVRGRVQVNASVPLGNRQLVPLLPEFCRRHPGVSVDLTLSDDLVDVLGEDADVVLRVGPLRDSSLAARRLGSIRRFVTASPDYLNRYGIPRHPEDLARHSCLTFNLHKGLNTWPFVLDKQVQHVEVSGSVSANNGETMRYLTLAGAGLSRLGEFLIGEDIRQGRLVPVLEAYNPKEVQPIHAVFAGRKNLPARVRVFVDFLAEALGEHE